VEGTKYVGRCVDTDLGRVKKSAICIEMFPRMIKTKQLSIFKTAKLNIVGSMFKAEHL